MSNAVPSALELERDPSRAYVGASRAAILVIVAIVTTAAWAGILYLGCLILGTSIGPGWLIAISGAISLFFVMLGLSMAAIGRDRTR